jgi:PKD repeat protein/type IV secretory pathway VirB2 component (pilin)
MRKNSLIILLLTGVVLLFGLMVTDTFASCGGSWFSNSCPVSPYCADGKCSVENGRQAVEIAVNGQITNKWITEYAQAIVTYLMGFISLVAVIYIIYAGFQLMIWAGDEEKMKKTRQIILYVILGILIMWLAYPIVKWTINLINPNTRVAFDWTIVPWAQAYTESDSDTYAEYKNKIKEWINQMESELLLNRSVQISTIQNVKALVQWGFDRLPDYGDVASINREAKQVVDTYLDLAIKNPNNSNHVGNAISRVANFVDKVNISRITGDISAGPVEGNAPLSVSFRADGIRDPSWTTPSDNNYVWWTRENGWVRRELSRGPSLSYTFTKEGTYTVFLDVISGSRNSKGKTDVLPLSVSKQILVKPKLGEIILLINGVNVSNMTSLKLSPTVGKMGVILDASASRAIGNGTIAETKWEFGNGNDSTNRGGPIVERQLYTNQWGYVLKLTMKTNDGQSISKEIQLLVRDPAAIIKLDSDTGKIGEDISMSATSYFADTRNVEYSWQIQDENGKKIVKVGEGTNFKHKFETVGSYIVSLTAKSPNGTIDTDSRVITIESRDPVVTIDTPRPIAQEKPNAIVFDASKSYDPDTSSRKNLSYTWRIDWEKVSLGNIENDGAKWNYTFDNKWTHTISVTVANTYGKITTVEKEFEVISTLAVNMIITPKVVQRGSTVTIIGQSSNAEFFEWNMGDGTPLISGTARSVQHIYKQSGVYSVVLNVNRNWGTETNTITRKVYVSDTDSPFAIIDATNSSSSIIEEKWACNGLDALVINRADTTTFNSSNSMNVDGSTNGLTYTWKYFGKARTTPQISEKFNELGCFPIELTVRSNKNGASHTTTQYIKLANHPPELTSLTSSIDSAKKDSQKILVKVQANGATDIDGVITSYIWYYTTESDPEPQNVQITQKNGITFVLPNITEKYFFGVILEDNDGAKMNTMESGQSPTPLIVDNSNGNINLPLINLSVSKSTTNVGEKVLFSADVKTIIPGVNIANKSEYAWDWDGDGRIDEKSNTSSMEHIYTRSGDYNMKIRVTNNGVSNSKYQTIHVKNKLKAAVYGYRLPDNKIFLMNASEGSYETAHWEIGSIVSESPTSVVINDTGALTTGKLTISSNTSDISTVDIDLKQLETLSGTGLLYQSYPRAINDTITVKNPGDRIFLSMYGNTATNYAIDTDAMIDTSLDGIPNNDVDNKLDTSYNDGSIYSLSDLWVANKREHKMVLSLISSGAVVNTRMITIILDYIASTSESGISLTGSTAWLSDWDRVKLEELSKLIRELTDSDRIILMQRYNTLVENWNNTFDKAKSLIDIQEGIESGAMNNEQKTKLSKIVDDLLVGDSQVTDEVGIASLQRVRTMIYS